MPPEFTWDGRSQRYRNKETGRFVSNQVVTNLIERNVDAKTSNATVLFNQMIKGEISLESYQRETAEILKYAHTQNYLLAKGGFRATKSEEYLQVARDLKNKHYPALQALVKDLNEGKLTKAQAEQRINNLIAATRGSYNYGKKQSALENGYNFAKRYLGAAEHCIDCPIYAALGVVSIEQLILPGEQCECRFNCKCVVRYFRNKEDANT